MNAPVDRPLVYLAAPYTRPDPVANTNRVISLAESLLADGVVTPVVPHLNIVWQLVAPHADPEYWYAYDLAILARCDALYRVAGESTGASREWQFAQERGIRCFNEASGIDGGDRSLYGWARLDWSAP